MSLGAAWARLAGDEEVVVLLAALHEQVAPVDELLGGDQLVRGAGLLLIDTDASGLDELAQLTLGGEDGGILRQELDEATTSLELGSGDLVLRYPLEDGQQRSLVQPLELLACALTEENARGGYSGLVVGTAVYQYGELLRQATLQRT